MPYLHRALEQVPLPQDASPFRAADLGAAAGTNSMEPLRAVVDDVRARAGYELPVTVVHTDIAGNDFNALFSTIHGSPDSYAHRPGVHAYAASGSFYGPLFPPAELHLVWSAIAVQWLSRLPVVAQDHIYPSRADSDMRRALREQSRSDWEVFLTHRAAELRPGGRMVILGGAAADDGSSGAEGLMDTANAVLVELVEQGLLDADEHARMMIPTWNRTLEEFLAPLRAEPLERDLSVEEHSLVALPDILLEEYQATRDAEHFGNRVAGFFEAAFGPSLFSALIPGSRSSEAVDEVMTEFRTRLAARAAADPGAVETHWHLALLRIVRR
ncbi:class I SAM-dependent methyltransferase [Streptomyces sp. WAC04114]|uniref:class I SAM-dependent methyltransferase n=1 Tax=Streptomyces sp. WAC04114 TaxID=2867961 RepID=UPI001C8B4571|nr:class I SAM-dependent methyltransferase [Streptomyces sp. WAC04114]MBX9361089.1 class I SAM-dependent methyltransferase [Streptomyces sp. WAC04114]